MLCYSNDTSVTLMTILKYCVSFSLNVIVIDDKMKTVVIVVVWVCRDLYRN